MVERDVIITPFAADLGQLLDFFLVIMCQIDVREGAEKLVKINPRPTVF